MKILVINWQDIRNPLSGGAEVHCHEIFKRIASQGHHVTLLCCGFDGCPPQEQIDGINIVRIGGRNDFNYHVPSYYRRHFRNKGFDIVIDDINKIPFFTPLYVREPILAISHHFFGRSIYRETDFLRASYVFLSEKLVDVVYKKTPFAVVSDSTRCELIERGFEANNLHIIRNAIDHTQFPMRVQAKSSQPLIAYFGRIKKYKSPDHLVRAFELVKRAIPDAMLWFMGSGDFKEELQNLAQQLDLSESIVFHNRVSEQQKIEMLSQAWCVVNTSMKEGWGITNIEANACGTPVIAANVPGLRDSVSVNKSGWLYEYGNITELSAKIVELCQNQTRRTELSLGAVDWARSFSWDEEAEKLTKLCFNIIDSAQSLR